MELYFRLNNSIYSSAVTYSFFTQRMRSVSVVRLIPIKFGINDMKIIPLLKALFG